VANTCARSLSTCAQAPNAALVASAHLPHVPLSSSSGATPRALAASSVGVDATPSKETGTAGTASVPAQQPQQQAQPSDAIKKRPSMKMSFFSGRKTGAAAAAGQTKAKQRAHDAIDKYYKVAFARRRAC
jgi:hypothetical protein